MDKILKINNIKSDLNIMIELLEEDFILKRGKEYSIGENNTLKRLKFFFTAYSFKKNSDYDLKLEILYKKNDAVLSEMKRIPLSDFRFTDDGLLAIGEQLDNEKMKFTGISEGISSRLIYNLDLKLNEGSYELVLWATNNKSDKKPKVIAVCPFNVTLDNEKNEDINN